MATGINPPSHQWTGGGHYLAWFGRYSVQHKGIDNMLSAYAAVPREHRLPLRLRGIDYMGGKSEVRRLVSLLGLDSDVSVGGPVLGEEKVRFLSEAAGFLFPSRWESQGIALLEALGMGVPSLVSSSIHLADELAGASASIIVDFSDRAAAAKAMTQVVGAAALGANARKYVQTELAWDCQFDALMSNVYRYAT
ncbi:glycosyltransferase [Arthrobacter sp. S13_S34]|nr:glycosyltransferase [Arthrobacter sp. S13_S34]